MIAWLVFLQGLLMVVDTCCDSLWQVLCWLLYNLIGRWIRKND